MKHFTFLNVVLITTFLTLSININAQSTAVYDVTYNSNWNATQHTSIPTGDHYSNLVGASHKNENEYFQLGQNASLGIKNVAEFGSNSALMGEVQNSANTKDWYNVSFSPNNAATGSATITDIEVTEEHHLLTLVSMIAPSPDWFIAVNSLDLRNNTNTNWKPSFTVDVFVYDAGTDSGTNYTSANSPTNPQVGIFMINNTPFNGNKIGELIVTLKSTTLDTQEFDTLKSLKLFPNPSNGNVSIIGDSISNLKTITIYNLLGSKVKVFSTKTPTKEINLNLTDLKKGVYLVNLITKSGITKTKKLVLQ